MDPETNLREQLSIARVLATSLLEDVDVDNARRLAELVLALDGWLKDGGFLPSRWSRNAADSKK